MAEKKNKASESWTKQSMQLPKHVSREFRNIAAESGTAGVKMLGTVGSSLVVAMPVDMREELMLYAVQQTWKTGDGLDASKLWSLFEHLVFERRGIDLKDEKHPIVQPPKNEDGEEWAVRTIHDPELTPPPGEKLSDRGGVMKTPKKAAPNKKRGSA